MSARVQVVLPVHNEAASIAGVLEEFHAAAAGQGYDVAFVVAEDGSTDDTCAVVRSLTPRLPVTLLSSPRRKGYSRAVLDGLRATTASRVVVVDGDGQCDPADLDRFLQALAGADLVVGYRHPRADPWARRAMSALFAAAYRAAFDVRLRDPSCPFVALRRERLGDILQDRPGTFPQGFWWEFHAWARAAGLTPVQVPVRHRPRRDGATRVYRPLAVPGLAVRHLLALWRLRRELGAAARR
jgi:glycosyltransferase involved in cell wall biosynthesis